MKRGWLGIGLLAVLLALGIFLQFSMDQIHTHCADTLEQAAQAAENGQWERAAALADQAYQGWQKGSGLTAAVADHSPMDEVDMMYAELRVYAGEQENPHFSATCVRLAELIRAVAEAHRFTLQNLL